jgi:hypothetical protein
MQRTDLHMTHFLLSYCTIYLLLHPHHLLVLLTSSDCISRYRWRHVGLRERVEVQQSQMPLLCRTAGSSGGHDLLA